MRKDCISQVRKPLTTDVGCNDVYIEILQLVLILWTMLSTAEDVES